MAIRSFPFNSINGDRKYNAFHWAEYFATFIGNGVFPNPSDGLQAIANNDMTVTVKKGNAWINGYILINDNDYVLNIDPADGILDRKDRVVVRWDAVDREIRIEVKKGELSSNPVAPNLQRDVDAYELGLANIYIAKGVIGISQSSITDLRLNKNYCGIVHGTVDQVDTTTLFNQYQTWLQEKKNQYNQDLIDWTENKQTEYNNYVSTKQNEYDDYVLTKQTEWDTWFNATTTTEQGNIDNIKQQFQQDFNNWFATIQDVLDENTAGNLYNMIEAIPKVLSGPIEPEGIKTGDYWFREV